MELQDLKEIWNEYDKKLDKSIRLNTGVLKEIKMEQMKSRTHRISIGGVVELVLNAIVVLWLGSFIADHIGILRFVVPAVVLDVAAIALLIASVYPLVVLKQLDYGEPLLVIQKKLGALRALKIQTTKWVFVSAVLVWTPLLIVGLKALFGVDAYVYLGSAYLIASLVAGFVVIAIAIGISKRYGNRIEHSPFMQRLMDDISGRNLNAARAYISEIQRFEQENNIL